MAKKIVVVLVVYTALVLAFLTLAFFSGAAPHMSSHQAIVGRAVLGMGLTLNLVWCLGCGLLMLRLREPVTGWLGRLPGAWQVKFVIACTLLAMAEEAVTTTITNLAPLYGTRVGEAYITASANYIDVITRHSVVVFVPMFVGWAWMLSRWRFTPTEVFLLFGASGSIAEAQFGGNAGHLIAGFWYFVYGLMVWWPAFLAPEDRPAGRPRWWHFPLAIVLPGLFVAPVAIVLGLAFPHPRIDFKSPAGGRALTSCSVHSSKRDFLVSPGFQGLAFPPRPRFSSTKLKRIRTVRPSVMTKMPQSHRFGASTRCGPTSCAPRTRYPPQRGEAESVSCFR